jgi:hypothetical protein
VSQENKQPTVPNGDWFSVTNIEEVDSPARLIYPERVEENVRRMIALAGGPNRLCPHVNSEAKSRWKTTARDRALTI